MDENKEYNEKPDLNNSPDFIRNIIRKDVSANKNEGVVHTRFPPEPNGYLHIGHAKAICLNFDIAKEFDGLCNLRYDDTNPSKEEIEYVDSIAKDIRWLGFDWDSREYYASDYFDQMYAYAIQLIKKNKAYVCDLSAEEIREYRGTLTEAGKESPSRNRAVSDNLELFEKMKNAYFSNGEKVLRATIDMSSPNLNMRDPVIYRILRDSHHRTKDKWCIYPMYDFAHCISDSIEGITHSLCTLEFEAHRPLYDWFLEQLSLFRPRQIEFARLNLTYTILSKRKLQDLVNQKHVNGWDDPRMPTIAGMRNRGYSPEAIKTFCDKIGIAKRENIIDIALLEHCVRDDLNKKALRVMAVLNPLKVIITNYPKDKTEFLDAINNPEDVSAGTRKILFAREIYIERDDFMENPSKKFFRLSPGKEVRLRYAYFLKCEEVIKDNQTQEIIALRCTYDVQTKGGKSSDGRKVKGTIHWVCVSDAQKIEVRLYDRLFCSKNPLLDNKKDFKDTFNHNSLKSLTNCFVESSLSSAKRGQYYQFERKGYFCLAPDSQRDKLIFNRTVSLRDSWKKAISQTEDTA